MILLRTRRVGPVSLAVVASLAATAWFLFLSGWFNVQSGAALTVRRNVMFHSDASLWFELLTWDDFEPQRAFRYFSHGFMYVLWRPITRCLTWLLRWFATDATAPLLAARLLMASAAGASVGAMIYLAIRRRVAPISCACLWMMAVGFTTNVIVVMTEHFGFSAAMLTVTFVAFNFAAESRRASIVALVGAIAATGTTITNGAFVVLGLLQIKGAARWKGPIALLLGTAGLLALVVGLWMDESIRQYVTGVLHISRLYELDSVASQVLPSFIYPAVGPEPIVRSVDPIREPRLMVSYTPFGATRYTLVQGAAALAWLVLFVQASIKAFSDPETRTAARVLTSWILFSIVLTLTWGDEWFLYSPQWAWALMTMVILGARHISPRTLVPLASLVALGQLHTLQSLQAAVTSIAAP